MGRPLKKKLFGANAINNLKVQFYNGTASVAGYITKQNGSKKFVVREFDDNTDYVCRLVPKVSGDLAVGEMSITVKTDAGTAIQISKISAHRVTASGVSYPWNFSTSTSDNAVEIEEAGTDTAGTDATDLEGDETSSSITYTAGIEYAEGNNLEFDGTNSIISMTGMLWSNLTAFNTVKAQPSGTVYTATATGVSGTITLTGAWGGGGGYDYASATGAGGFASATYQLTSITFAPSPLPTVFSMSPGQGPEAGGTTITITGLNFTGATAVTMGSTPVASFTVVDATTITAVTPAGTGFVNITVTTPLGTNTSSANFGYE